MLLSEYSFYIPEFDDPKGDVEDLLLGEEGEDEEEFEDVAMDDEMEGSEEDIPADDLDLPDDGGEMEVGGEETGSGTSTRTYTRTYSTSRARSWN